MKAIVCEMCGGSDIVKQGDFFVCQHCGVKYEPESAKKLLVEVKVNTNDKDRAKKLTELGMREKRNVNFKTAADYFNEALVYDPNNVLAFFYAGFVGINQEDTLSGMLATAKIYSMRLSSTLSLMASHSSKEEAAEVLPRICLDLIKFCNTMKTAAGMPQYQFGSSTAAQASNHTKILNAYVDLLLKVIDTMQRYDVDLPGAACLGEKRQEQVETILKDWRWDLNLSFSARRKIKQARKANGTL